MKIYEKKANTSSEFSVKDVDTAGRVLSVYWSAFDNKDRDGDVIVKGAFTKTVKEQGPAGLGEQWFIKFHNTDLPIVTPFEIIEDNYGLLARVRLAEDIDIQNDTLKMYRDKHFKHQSIGFQTVRQQKMSDYNEIREVKLYEGSVVLWAANPNAIAQGIKSYMSPKEISDEITLTVKGLRNGDYTDNGFKLLEIKLRQLIQASADLMNSTPAADAQEPQKADEARAREIKSLIELFK